MGSAQTELTIQEVREVSSGERLLVRWSGGNGPFEYEVKWDAHGNLLACAEGLPDGYPGMIMTRGDKRLINRVWRP